MSNLFRRSLSLVLTLVMVLGMVPANVFAADTTPDADVASVQAMIDALPGEVNADSEAEYVQKLGELQKQLEVIIPAAEALTEEQLAQVDSTKLDNALYTINAYSLGKTPMLVAVSADQNNPSVYSDADGVINGYALKTWLGRTENYVQIVNSQDNTKNDLTLQSEYSSSDVTLALDVLYLVQTKARLWNSYSTVGYFKVQAPTVTVSVTKKDPVESVPMNGYYGPRDQKDALSAAIYNAVVASTNHPGTYTIKVEDTGTISGWFELDSLTFSKNNFKPGQSKKVKIVWAAANGYPAHEIEATVTLRESRPSSSVTAQDVTLSQADWPAQSLQELVAGSVSITNPTGAEVVYSANPALADPGDGNTYNATYTVSIADSADVIGSSASAKLTITNFLDVNDNDIDDATEPHYTVIYKVGDEEVLNQRVVEGAATPAPTAYPTREYYAFAGWGNVAATVTANATYTAQWTPVKDEDGDGIADEEDTFIISWDTDGDGDVDKTTELPYGANPENSKPEHAPKANHSPNGWSPEFVTVTGKKTYTAQYSQDTVYTITFKVDGEVYETLYVNVTKGETVASVADPDKDYAVFDGWTNASVIGTVPTGDVTLEAQWLADTNNNNVCDEDETGSIAVTIVGNGVVTLSGGSKITDNGDGTYTVLFDSVAENGNVITVTATPNDTDGTDGSADYLVSAPETVTVTDGKTTDVEAKFATESIDVAATGEVYINGFNVTEKLNGLKDKVLTAAFGAGNYNAADYTVYMVLGTGNVDVESTGTLDKLNMTTRFNVGDNQSFIIQKNGAVVVSDTISISVKDSRQTLAISASDVTISGKTEPADVMQQVKNAVSIKTTDPQTGAETVIAVSDSYLTFEPSYAWPEDAQTGTFTVTVKVNSIANETYSNAPSATLTLACTDTTILYTVTYLDGLGNTLYSDKTAEFLPTPTIEDPTRTYYTFAGWTPAVADTVTGDVTYTATWTPVTDVNGNTIADEEETYTVIYAPGYEGAGAIATFENLNWGDATPTIANPTREGYNFLGWDVTPAATVTAPTSGNTITYTALWTELHAVIFIDRENQESFEIKDGDTVAEPAIPTWDDDHDFLGWFNGEDKYDFASPVTESLTITAAWREDFNHNDIDDTTEAHYTVIYVVNGEETKFENLLVDTATPVVADPTVENFKFVGWNPEVAETVTADVTYVAQFVNDINNNGVEDALETITLVVNTAAETDVVTLNGETVTTYVYDSTTGETITFVATPTTHMDGTTVISDTFVSGITVDDDAVTAAYGTGYAANYALVLPAGGGSKTVTVTFQTAAFTWNDERIMNYYDGMTGIGTEDIYTVAVAEPSYAGATEAVVKYKARDAMSHTIYIDQLNINDLTKRVLKLINGNKNEIVINMDTLWMDVNDQIEESVSLQQAVETYFTTENIEGIFDAYTNAGGIGGGMTSLNAAKAELDKIFSNITAAAMYYGAHNFGYNNTTSETVDELLLVTYKNEAMYIVGQQTITLKDLRETSYIKGNNVSVMYKDYTDEDLLAAIGTTATDANGNPIPGAVVYSLDIQDPYTFEGRNVSDAAYELTMKYAGNETYKPSQAVFTVTVTKAPASMDVPNVNVYYGTDYSLTPNVTLGNAYGESTDITDSAIQFIIGLDAADLDVNADGITGINGTVQLRLPKELQDMLDMVTGSDSTGLTMSLSQLNEYLSLLDDSSVEALNAALSAITKITEAGDIQITIGGDLPTDIGVYLHGSVSTSSNYETAYDVGYLIIKPKATQVYLDFNYHDANGIITKDLLSRIDLGASAYDEAALETLNPDATEEVRNLYFGLDETGNVITSLDASTLGNGAYTQLSFIADFGNELYYAVPIVRAFIIVPNVTNVELVDAEGNAKDEFTFTFDNTPKNLLVRVDGEIVDHEVLYYGVQTNTKLHKAEDGAPVHAGVYTATVTYVTYDENGEILSVGADMAVITIAPTESEISVTGGSVVYDGESHGATVEATSTAPGLKPDVTVISGTVLVDGDKDGIGLEDIQGVANIDFPTWLDAILSQRFEGAYASGVTVKDFSYKLEQYADKLIELGLTEEMVNSLRNLLKNLPENVTLTFNDNVTYTEVGAYVFLGVVTDSDHVPSMDTGLLLIQKADMEFDLLDTTVTYDGNEHFVDVTNPNNSDYLYVVINRENNVGNIVLEDDLNDLLAILEDKLGRELPKSMDVGELMNAVDTILTEVESYEGLPVTAGAALTKLREVLAELPQSGTVTINGKNPVDVGKYEIYAITYSLEYATQASKGVLEILPIEIEVIVDNASKVYGETDPELTCSVVDKDGNAVDGVVEVTLTRAEGEDVGKYPIAAEVNLLNKNYKVIAVTEDAALTITPFAATVTVNDATKVYGEADPEFTYETTVDELIVTLEREQGEDVGEYAIKATVSENPNYTVTVVDGAFTITPKAVTITAADATKVFGDADPDLTTDCTIAELNAKAVREAGENVGEYKITVEYTANANYTVTTVDGTFTITPKAITITAADATKVFGDADPALTTDCTVAELNAKAVREAGENVGEYKITVEYTANANYTVTTVDGTFTITPKAITITANDATKVFGEVDPALTTDCTVAELNAKAVREAGENVGTYAIKVEYTENANYTVTTVDGEFTITPKAVTITAADATKVFGENDPELTTDCTIAELNAKAVREAGENVGTYAIKVEFTENANYTVTTVDGTFTITPKAVTITAADATKVFGEADPALTTDCTIAELNAKAVREAGENVGEYKITVEYTENANYTVTTVDGKFTITPKAVTITAADATKVFGEADPALTTDCTIAELNAKAVREAGENVGEYKITVEYTENPNYTVTTVDGTFTITPKAITITAADATKVFGDADPALTTDCEIAELNAKAVREAGENVGEYKITVEYTANANYTVTTVDGKFTITPKAVTITAADATKVFGEADPALTTDCTVAELNAKAVREAGENVGEYKITVEYTANANYTVTTVDGKFTITPKAVTITAADKTKVFGEADPALTTDCTVAELNAKAVREAGENVGEYKITVEYTENPNYTVTVADGSKLTITQRSITVKLDDATIETGDALPTFTYTITEGELPEGGSLNLTITSDAADTTVPGTYTITAENNDPNYAITVEDAALTIVDSHAGLYPIYFDPTADDTGTIKPGNVVEIDGVPYILDDDTTVWVPHTTGKLATTYKYKVGESYYETYPTNMYVWILKITDTDGDGEYDLYTAERVKELDDFMLYAGTSIRINSNPGIRFFTTVPADKYKALMNGKLLTGELAGFKMVRSGTLYVKWREETSNLIMGVGVSSDVYGGAAGNTFRRFSTANGRDWFTGMLTNLPDDPETLSMDILSRPYIVLERDGEQIVIYGGTVRRSVYYVATQNRDVYEAGTAYDNYIENIITIVENAKNG